jgi:BirA family transcriptional regulator, biotin operon repressor / biotin---[acetyl-CoA-carboxylase] ligase
VLVGSGGRKTAGILVQGAGDAVVAGVGLNVTTTAEELPVETATSLAIEGSPPDRTDLLVAILARLGARYTQWDTAGGDAEASGLAGDYRARCVTIGRDVAVSGTDGSALDGFAEDVDADGRLVLVLAGDGRRRVVAAGDVRHLR